MGENILQLTENYVRHCFATADTSRLTYHNITHTEKVVFHTNEIASWYNLAEADKRNVLCAAWFHDLGYLYTIPGRHEEKSVELMRNILEKECSAETVDAIGKIIMATRTPTQPHTLPEQIICDADTYHFGTPEFVTSGELVKKELEWQSGMKITDWNQRSLALLLTHRFYTSYCIQKLTEGKLANVKIFSLMTKEE